MPGPDASAPLRVDRVLGGRYRLIRPVAKGGMAEVWEGYDDILARAVAIKILLAHLASDGNLVERFRREAVAAARLTHPGVVATYDTGTDAGTAWIVMELVRGHTLRQLLSERGPMDPPMAVDVAGQIADALAHAHRAGLVHRDIKPANVLLVEEDGGYPRAKVTDFGIAKATEGLGLDLTRTGMVLGTPKYLSPEQVEGHEPDARADLYSLGVVLFEMLGGRAPFEGPTDMATAIAHVRQLAPRLSTYRPEVSPELDQLVADLLEKDPASRPPSAVALRRALARIPTTSPAPPGPLWPPGSSAIAPRPTRTGLPPPAGPPGGSPAGVFPSGSSPLAGSSLGGSPPATPSPALPLPGGVQAGGLSLTGPSPGGPTPGSAPPNPPPQAAPPPGTEGAALRSGTRDVAGRSEPGPTAVVAPSSALGGVVGGPRPLPTPGVPRVGRDGTHPDESLPGGPAGPATLVQPPGGSRSARARRRRRRRWGPGLVVTALVAAGCVVAYLLLNANDAPDRAGSSGNSPGSAGVATQSGPPKISAVTLWMNVTVPESRLDNPSQTSLTIDGNPDTYWSTDEYRSATFGGLYSGEGLAIQLNGTHRLHKLVVDTPTPGWAAQVYVAGSEPTGGQEVSAWGPPAASKSGIQGSTTFDLGGKAGGWVLLWLTDLGPKFRAQVNELSIS